MSKKILDLIPESLHEELFKEVKEALKAKGFRIIEKGENNEEEQNEEELDADIKKWADSQKSK